jgi:DNA-binding PadR family transcriptional regulator
MRTVDTRFAVLQALIPGESYGRDIIERVRQATSGTVRLLQGQVYPALARMARVGLVVSHNRKTPYGIGRPRRCYRLTTKGRRMANDQARAVYALLRPALRSNTVAVNLGTRHGRVVS